MREANSTEYTVKEAAELVGVSDSRIRQLCLGDNPIEYKRFGQMLVITQNGVNQAKARNIKKGRPFGSKPMEVNP